MDEALYRVMQNYVKYEILDKVMAGQLKSINIKNNCSTDKKPQTSCCTKGL